MTQQLPVIVAGGGIGGLAAALALVRQGFSVKVLEQAPEIGETGEAFRKRFGNPYAVIHRVDVHLSLLEGAQETGRVEFLTSTRVERIEQDAESVTVYDQHGNAHRGVALIGADGVKSVVRAQYVTQPRKGGVGRHRRQRRGGAELFPGHLSESAPADRPAEELEALGDRGPRADCAVVVRTRHAARRRCAPDDSVHGAGRVHDAGRRSDVRRGAARERQRLREGVRPVPALARRAHRAHRAVVARDGPPVSREGRRAPGAKRAVEGPLAGALLRRRRSSNGSKSATRRRRCCRTTSTTGPACARSCRSSAAISTR